MRQIERYLPAVGAALFAPTVLFITAPNSVILLNMKEIGYDWGLVIILLQAFMLSALLCALVFVLALRFRAFAWLSRLLILLGASVLVWDALSPLTNGAGMSVAGGLLIEGVAFLALALPLFRLKLGNLYLIFGAVAPVLLISGMVSHYTTVKAMQEARPGRTVESARVVGSGATQVQQSLRGTGGWRLLRYEVDEGRLAQDQAADLRLYWVPLPGIEPVAAQDFHQVGSQWVQVIRGVRNLVPNGGFEQKEGLSGFPYDLYKAPPETRQVIADTRNGQATQVAVLKNTQQAQQTSLVSAPNAVSPKRLYLQAGWLRTSGGSQGYLGRLWLPKGLYDFFVKSDTQVWFHYRQIVQPPAGVTQVQVGVANIASVGQVYCDDMVFVELGQVNEAACQQPSTPGAPLRCGPPLSAGAGNSTSTTP